MTQPYTKTIGMYETGRRLHVLYGHETETGFKWDALCGCKSHDMPQPLYFHPDTDRVTCKACLREIGRVRKTSIGRVKDGVK